MANRLRNYVFTEAELQRVLGGKFPDQFIKDYIAGKTNSEALLGAIDANTAEIEDIQLQLTTINGQITVINGQIVTLQSDLEIVADDLADHVAAQSAHGAIGDIVGTLDYCSATVGGVVFLATAVGDSAPITIAPPSAVAAAPVAYNQAYEQTQADAINALTTNIAELADAISSVIDVVNSSLATERAAKQRAT